MKRSLPARWRKVGLLILAGFFILSLGIAAIILASKSKEKADNKVIQKDKYAAFTDEIFSKIEENYWEKISDQDLSTIYGLGIQKISKQQISLKSQDRKGVEEAINEVLKTLDASKKTEFLGQLTDMVLANLKPFGRSRLYTGSDEKSLSQNVNNVASLDHFQILGVGRSATDKEITEAFLKTSRKLEASKSAEAKQQLDEVKLAYRVLSDKTSRAIYEAAGVDPTIEHKMIGPSIFYMHLTKFSPISLNEFQLAADEADKKGGEALDTLIFDLRGNIGGAIDSLPYFLGPFIGPDQYAYQFYHQGNKEDFKTLTGWMPSLVRYKKVVILIDNQSQSSAEVMAASLKKYNAGVLLGTTTKGWGTVERVIPLEHQIDDHVKFSIFLVHHVTLREDGQPIEGRGVDPLISIIDPNWKKTLMHHFNDPAIIKAISDIYGK